jgi:hypothetical protein
MKTRTTRILICSALWAMGACTLHAQNAARNWFFGKNGAITFNPGPLPQTLSGSALVTGEGSSSISDSSGSLLFYTDGQTVWNKNHTVMPNGTGLVGHSSSTQSALIVPCNCSKYFIFATDSAENSYANGLRYSVVDMSLNAGLGDVVTATKNTLLLAPAAEKLAAVSDGTNGFWVVGHAIGDKRFVAFHIVSGSTCTLGPQDPTVVSSAVGSSYTGGSAKYGQGQMKISPDGTKLAAVGLDYGSTSFVELFDFNKTTGQVSNVGNSNSTVRDVPGEMFYGAEFSPLGNRLYVTTIFNSNLLFQYDISAGSLATRILINNFGGNTADYEVGALQLAPNNVIYVARPHGNSGNGLTGRNYLSAIATPNALAAANNTGNLVGYTTNSVMLSTGAESRIGLPAMVAGNFSCGGATPTATPSPTATPNSTPTATPNLTATATSTPTETPITKVTPTPSPATTGPCTGAGCCPPWNSLIWAAVVIFFLTSFRSPLRRWLGR